MAFDKHFVADKHRSGWLEQQLNLDALRNSSMEISQAQMDDIAGNLALAILNICLPLDIRRIVFGRFRNTAFDETLVNHINGYLRKLSVLDLECRQPQCAEPGIVGCASIVTEPMLNGILNN